MYDLLVEVWYAIYRNGLSLTTIGAVGYVLLRQRRVKKRLKRYIPWLFEDESEVKGYIQNQQFIMENQRRMMERMGLEWHAPTLGTSLKTSAMKSGRLSLWRWITSLPVRFAEKFILLIRRKKFMKKLKSRKFILAVVGAALIIANDGLDLGIERETVLAFAGLLATWIVGESAVDAKRASANNEDGSDYQH